MKKNIIVKDERTEAEMNKAFSVAFGVTYILLLISVFIKVTILDLPFWDFGSELIIFLIGGIVATVYSFRNGNINVSFKGRDSRKNFIRSIFLSLLGGIVFATVIGLANYFKYDFDIKMLPLVVVPLFIQFTLLMMGFLVSADYIAYKISLKKIKEYELDDEDEQH